MAYDPVKAAQINSLLKQGFTEDQAFAKAGVPASDDAYYSTDQVRGSPTYGQVIKGPAATDYTEAQAAQDKVANDAAKKSWVDEEIKAETSGPTATRTTNLTVTTGGTERVTRMTPEMSDWTSKSRAAESADATATQAAKDEYLRTQGLDQASPSARRTALREAEANGQNFTVTTNKDALGSPPKNQYTSDTIPVNETGTQTPNDGTLTTDQLAKNSAQGQTAEQQVRNNPPTPDVVAGQGSPETDNEEKLTDKETKKLIVANNDNTPPDTGFGTTTFTGSGTSYVDDQESNTSTPLRVEVYGVGISPDVDMSEVAQTIPAQLLKNKLHDYTGYTYKITLFLLTVEDYSELSIRPSTFIPKYTLISSGGSLPNYFTAQQKTTWHPDFQEDFYIDNLSIGTVVGLNSRSKASNVIDISFNIIEPYGMSLLDRLLSACQTTAKCPNYIDQPYMLQIDFLSNPAEANTLGAKGHVIDQKRLAIKLTELKIKPGSGGTTYSVRAIPYNHIAFLQSAGSVPINLSVEADTVESYFDSRSELNNIFDKEAAKQEERLESELNKLNDPMMTLDDLERAKANYKAQFQYTTKSFPAAYNTYYRNIAFKENRFEQPLYQIAFIVDPIIGKSLIIDPNKTNSDRSPMAGRLENYNNTSASGSDPNFKKLSVFNVTSGTSVTGLIDKVITSSEYCRKQVQKIKEEKEKLDQQDTTNNTASGRETKDNAAKNQLLYAPVEWYKIIPSVTIGRYDKAARAYSKFITFSIVPYRTSNFYHPDFKFTKINSKQSVRTFEYFYTGNNQDIISLDIDFDATFVVGITAFSKQLERTNTYSGSDIPVIGAENAETSDTRPPSWLPFRTVATTADAQMSAGRNSRSEEDYKVASVARSLYSSYPRGDMLNIKVKIVGDPAFIKQDDMLFQPLQQEYQQSITKSGAPNSPPINPVTGQIIFDVEQVFVQLLVKGSIDIDDTKGLVNKTIKLSNGQETNGSFSGMYQVLRVQSDFTKGKFEQTLELIRVPDDAVEIVSESGANVVKPAAAGVQDEKQADSRVAPENRLPPVSAEPPVQLDQPDPNLKEAAQQPAIAPVSDKPGEGNPPQSDQPTNATPENANNSPERAPQTTAPLTFAEAFRKARKDFGNKPGGSFIWNGKTYQTNYQNEPYVKNPTPVYQ